MDVPFKQPNWRLLTLPLMSSSTQPATNSSKTLERQGVSDIGRKSLRDFGVHSFGIGVVEDAFGIGVVEDASFGAFFLQLK